MGSERMDLGGQIAYVKKIYEHPNYNPSKLIDFDFALLELYLEIQFSETIKPITLPNSKDSIPDGTLRLSGWGLTRNPNDPNDQLRQTSVPKVDDETCKESYNSFDNTDYVICAGRKEGGKNACVGDNGGPLSYNNGTATLVGVVSVHFDCAKPTLPTRYSKVAPVLDWIRDIINTK